MGIPQYGLSDEQLDFREAIRSISRDRVAPRAAAIDEDAAYPDDLRALFARQDLMGLPLSEDDGGTGTGALTLAIAIEEIARACASTAGILVTQQLGTRPIALAGTPEQRRAFLPRCAAGDSTPAFALTEPGPAAAMSTVAVRDGDAGWRLTGTKAWVTNVAAAAFHVVFARTGDQGEVGAFVVEASRPGVSIGEPDRKLGLRGAPTAELRLEDVSVPAGSLLGDGTDGLRIAAAALDLSRPAIAAQALGIAQAATDYAAGYARERRQFGQAIGDFEGIQVKLADMATSCAAARELLYQACARLDRGAPDAATYAAMARVFCSDVAVRVAGDAVQILGGYGYVREYPVERHLRDAKVTQIHETANATQRVAVARALH
jgi:alkylation response protein AidB-like acyl-CoA dehydrogenase